jgi:hypothetical protein
MQGQDGFRGKKKLEGLWTREIHSHFFKINGLPTTVHFKIFLENSHIF